MIPFIIKNILADNNAAAGTVITHAAMIFLTASLLTYLILFANLKFFLSSFTKSCLLSIKLYNSTICL